MTMDMRSEKTLEHFPMTDPITTFCLCLLFTVMLVVAGVLVLLADDFRMQLNVRSGLLTIALVIGVFAMLGFFVLFS